MLYKLWIKQIRFILSISIIIDNNLSMNILVLGSVEIIPLFQRLLNILEENKRYTTFHVTRANVFFQEF